MKDAITSQVQRLGRNYYHWNITSAQTQRIGFGTRAEMLDALIAVGDETLGATRA